MSSVLHKLFAHKDGKKSSKLGIFSRKPRQQPPPTVIELPSKDVKAREEASVFVAMAPPPDVRLVLFQECGDTSNRRSLFDSKSFEPQKDEPPEYTVAMSNVHQVQINNNQKPRSKSYQYVRGPQDMDILSEMLFGTVGMASRASSLKIHIMKNPQRLMLSRVFCVESSKETVSLDRGTDCQRPPNPVLSRRKAKTLPVPTPEPPHLPPPVPQSLASSLTSRITRSDSSSSLMSLTQILGASLGATGSLGSRSVPQSIPSNRAHSLPPATRQASRDSFTLTQEPHHGVPTRRTKVKIGFAVMFQPEPSNSSEFQRFFFEHFPLIESYVTFLKEQVESALNNYKRSRNEFNEAMMEALQVFTSRIQCIYSTPRLPRPVWSSLTTVTSQSSPWKGDDITIKCFISELARMVNQHNTRQKNFFMSGLITSVLTHHLGWVNTTLSPNNGEQNSQTIAYNPLWAQLGDLYGAVGTPTKVAKTVVIGEIHELVSTIISILSYFIRCSNISEVVDVPADMTPQAFSSANAALSMSYVESDLETTEYVLVSVDDDIAKSPEHDSEKETTKTEPPAQKEKPKRFSLCRKIKKSEPISLNKEEKDSTETPNGLSTLCRSRSSPGTAAKPQIKVVNRQKSSGNFENLPAMRLRTNSNDTFARPRGVQSRRTSREVSQRMSQSSSALVIPNFEQPDNSTVSSLEGSKSLCSGPTPTSNLLRKRLSNEDKNSSSQNLNTAVPTTRGQQTANQSLLPPRPQTRTHKRVSSEPFNVKNLKAEPTTSTSLVKTKSTYFPPVRCTFVDRIEPKVVNVAHVQRSQPVIAMHSPVSSPCLPRTKSSTGQKRPIMGFKTNEIADPTMVTSRVKHKSGSALQDKVPKIDECRDVFSPKKPDFGGDVPTDSDNQGSKFNFDNTGVRRTSSNVSTDSSVRRSSSGSSGKMRIAARRMKLADSSKSASIDEERDEGIPLKTVIERIPSVSLQHDEFDEYFNENDDKDEYIFFSTEKSEQKAENKSSMTENQASVTNPVNRGTTTNQSSRTQSKRSAPPIPTVPPCVTLKNHSSTASTQPTVTKSVNQKAEIRPCVTKNIPPPLPSVGPCQRSQSTKSEKGEKIITSPTKATPKSAPPLPAAPPVHRGPLYPKLDEVPNPTTTDPLPKASIYPKLNETPRKEPQRTGIYPKLDQPPPYSSLTESTLYPKLSGITSETPKNSYPLGPGISEHAEVVSNSEEDTENAGCFPVLKELSLRPVEFSEKTETKKTKHEDKHTKLTFGELLADYSPEYLWGFALHGTKLQSGFYPNVIRELQHSISRPVLDEPVSEAVSIVADTDKWSVRVLSSHRLHSDKIALPALNSKLVTDMLERITTLYQMSVPAEFCMQQLESSLGELVLKSRMLAGYVTGSTRVTMGQLSAVLGIESSDLPLLMALASCHSPQLAAKLL